MINQYRTPQRVFNPRSLVSALVLGVGVFAAVLLLLFLGTQIVYAGRIVPGVTMKGIDLGGLNMTDAASQISASYTFTNQGKILLQDGEKTWLVTPAQLGFFLDPEASAQSAFKTSRSNSFFSVLTGQKKEASPVFIFNQQTAVDYLAGLADQIDRPVREASLGVQGSEVYVNPGQSGRVLNIQASLNAVTSQVQSMQDGIVNLVVEESQPVIMDATAQADLTRAVLSQPLTLTLPEGHTSDKGPWQIDVPTLAQMLTFERVNTAQGIEYQISLNKPLFLAYLAQIQSATDQEPENARFIFNDETRQLDLLQAAKIGRKLDAEASYASVNEKLLQGQHSIPLSFTLTNPQVMDSANGADLGITELVSTYTSYFRGSTADRVQNIQTASARFHGLLVAPGATLSMSDVLGDISLDNGYAEAMIILGDQSIQGVGGGVCQVSTTLFRTVFFGGYPIAERHAHAYRVGYYEQTASGHDQKLAGLDATVFVPLVDFKFTNDTPYWLLMETYVSPKNYTLTWKFYSTRDGRTVDWSTTGPTDVLDALDPVYRENPELPTGKVKQVDWAVEGATVTVRRTVSRNGSVIYNDTIVTKYEPWRDVFEYGPGTEGMPPPPEEN